MVYPSKIQDVIHLFPELGPCHAIMDSARGLDCLTLRVEVKDGVHVSSAELADRLRTAVRSYLTITPVIEMMPAGTLAMGEGTSFRVLDYRKGSGRYAAAD